MRDGTQKTREIKLAKRDLDIHIFSVNMWSEDELSLIELHQTYITLEVLSNDFVDLL